MNKLDDIDFMEFVGSLEQQYLIRLSEEAESIIDRFCPGNRK